MTSKPYILTLVMLLFIGACTRMNDVVLQDTQCPVAFSASFVVEDNLSKAVGEISGVDDLRAKGFGVFACYTGLNRYAEVSVTADFMHNQEVTWDSEHEVWSYAPLKYWPNGEGYSLSDVGNHHVSFFAYGPYSDGDSSDPSGNPAGYSIPSFCNPLEEADPWIMYRIHTDIEKQVDLLYSQPLLDEYKPETGAKIPFVFKHALSCAGERVRVNISDGLREDLRQTFITLYDEVELVLLDVHVDYMLTPKAKLCLWNRGEANWKGVASEGGLTLRTQKVLESEWSLYKADKEKETTSPYSSQGRGVFFIPLDNPDQEQYAKVKAEYAIRYSVDGEVSEMRRSKETTLFLKDFFHEGKKLDINISLIN